MAKQVTIDAKGKAPGRVASEAVRVLLGKDTASWAPNRLPDITVVVTNAQAIEILPHRARTKVYRRHSGGPGGFREEPFLRIFQTRPEEVIRRAVRGMLPKNRLRAHALRRLYVYAGSGPNRKK